jgi:hypothetical protein
MAAFEEYMTVSEGCPYCLDLDLERVPKVGMTDYRESRIFAFTKVVIAAASGCKGCHVLRFAVEPYVKRIGAQQVYLRLFYFDGRLICDTYKDDRMVHRLGSFEIFAPIAEEFSSSPRGHNSVFHTS